MPQTYHPTTRVLAVLELLQTHGQLTGAELASRLDVDRRSLRRYIVMLEEMGIPITTERGRHGGYALMPGFKLPPMMFSDDEALALAIGLIAARSLGLGLENAALAIASAQAKLERIMPVGLQQKLRAVGDSIKLDLRQASTVIDNTTLLDLSSAATRLQRVHLSYQDASGVHSERDFDPYGLAFHSACWYATGMCHLRHDIRSFRLDRINSVTPVAVSFQRPTTFNALSYLRKAVATIPRAYTVEVVLKTDMQTARRHLFDAIGVLVQADDSSVVLYNQSDDLNWFARQLASFPFDFEIRKPAKLKREIQNLSSQLLRCI
ncbi:helix-turn-helix transcriptional regulator [Undibacterium sp. TJN19]|uniref:helix-turn-helix transcriptional regulator n=1 Tax=Undibacterium sp. TJN19 TaxID=3413055 RepID=UPI003BF00FA9